MKNRHYQSHAGIFATMLTFGSFAFGTLLLALRLLLPYNNGIIYAGFYYVAIAMVINGLALLALLYYCIVRIENRAYYGQKIFLMLCNIPVAALYTYAAFELIH